MSVGEKFENPPTRSNAFIAAGASELQFLFVRGMPIIITSKVGHESWKICNGRTATAHSFLHHESAGFVMPAAARTAAGAGKVFTILQPEYVNVKLAPMKSEPADVRPIIIPISANKDKSPIEQFLKHAPRTAKECLGGRRPAVRAHPIEPGFSYTYNKLQGATMDRLILVLHDLTSVKLGAMTLQKVYVALSRVREGKHLAIFPATSNQLQHLVTKKYPSQLQAWDTHYDQTGNWKTGAIILPEVDVIFNRVWLLTQSHDALAKANGVTLKAACRALGITYANLTVIRLREALADAWAAYMLRRQAS